MSEERIDYGRMFRGLGAARPEERREKRVGLFRRLAEGLGKSRRALADQIRLVAFDPADESVWEQLEEALLMADCGVPATAQIVQRLEEEATRGAVTTTADLTEALERVVAERLGGLDTAIDLTARPTVVMIIGVNGTGKTTTIGKLAEHARRAGASVVVGAADTFRAAAGEQLETWAARAKADFVGSTPGQDPGAVAFDAVGAGISRGRDLVLVDTAGRLHTQVGLMEELAKVRRVIAAKLAGAPHETLLVIDATTGQNGLQQARLFNQSVPITGVVLTKLDGTARGGIVLAIVEELGVPIKLIGIGETIEDLRPFDAAEYARGLIRGSVD